MPPSAAHPQLPQTETKTIAMQRRELKDTVLQDFEHQFFHYSYILYPSGPFLPAQSAFEQSAKQ